MKIIKRKEWKAGKPFMVEFLRLPVKYVLLRYNTDKANACSCEKDCAKELRKLQDFHMTFYGYPDIQFNFLISSDGSVYEGRGWKANPTKADYEFAQYMRRSLDIAYIGDFNNVDPTEAMVEARKKLINYGILKKYIDPDYTLLEARQDSRVTGEELLNAAKKENYTLPMSD